VARVQHGSSCHVHFKYIHDKQSPWITGTELAIMAAYHPLLDDWRAVLATQRTIHKRISSFSLKGNGVDVTRHSKVRKLGLTHRLKRRITLTVMRLV
jgi:hypothetical protein